MTTRSVQGKLLLACWLLVLSSSSSSRPGVVAFAPMPGFGLRRDRAPAPVAYVNNVNRADVTSSAAVPPPADQQLPEGGRLTSSLHMVGGVLDQSPDLTPAVKSPESLSPLEVWCLVRIEKWYSKALNRRCPFLRRRMTDFIDTLEMLIRISVIRREKIDLAGPEVSLRGDERTKHKIKHMNINALAAIIRRDWKEDSQKGYYITGRLTPAIYRDDCLFDGPDPDMPVRGLRKFLNAASQLFDPKESVCELVNLEIRGDVVVADWKMNGVLRLPWRPRMPEVQGQTTYHFDEDGLIHRHEETWDLSALDAFLKTTWFDFQFKAAHSYNEELQEAEVYE